MGAFTRKPESVIHHGNQRSQYTSIRQAAASEMKRQAGAWTPLRSTATGVAIGGLMVALNRKKIRCS